MVTEDEDPSGLASESVPVPQVQEAPVTSQEPPPETSRNKPRHRKKALHAMILKQMEFYFGDANLSKDRFLSNLIQNEPWVDLDVFLRFNKIRTLTQETSRIAKAIKASSFLELSESGDKVRRTTPIKPRENCEACSVYVQGLPPDADHDWLISIFTRYGPIAYVSIPKYKSNKKLKGFAFIEFETVESADECLKAFEDKDCTLPSHTSPQELLSITTFSEDDPPSGIGNTTNATLGSKPIAQDVQCSKRKMDTALDPEGPTKPKKSRPQDQDSNPPKEKKPHKREPSSDPEQMSTEEPDDSNMEASKKKKRKRKHRTRTEQPDLIDFGLRIMAKRDWKKLRNKYLELQREKMKQLKQHLRKTRWNQYSGDSKKERAENWDMRTEGEEMTESVASIQSKTPKFTFSEGLIVKIELDEPCTNPKSFKNEFRSEQSVKYIDVRESANVAYVRCETTEGAKSFLDKFSEDKVLSILSGDEESRYWEKMARDREEKLGKRERPKQRGRDKLLKKAEKELGKHIKFDEV